MRVKPNPTSPKPKSKIVLGSGTEVDVDSFISCIRYIFTNILGIKAFNPK